jgi:predicted DCC family thiol-disulfide oxidoreductase YuxK
MTDALFLACERAVHAVTPAGAVYRAGRAVVAVLVALGWPVGWLGRRPFAWPVEGVYWLVARHRGRFGWLCRDV